MNNKTIVLGYVDMDWHFAMGKYSCNCATIEDTNAFDNVICGILYRSNSNMRKSEIATIIGFNVIDLPDQDRYCDQSESAIFEDAVQSLIKYGLITEIDDIISLTEQGRKSCESKKKQKHDIKDVELWVDEFAGLDLQQEMINGLSYRSCEFANHPDWNVLTESPLDVLAVQHKELVSIQDGKSVTDINCNSMCYYVANLQCKICYNLESQDIYVCSAVKSQEIDNMLLNNALLRCGIIDNFFANQQVSVIYKPTHQIEIEKFILNRESEVSQYNNRITHKNDFITKLNFNQRDNESPILFFSIYEINDEIRQVLRKLKCDIVCVDFVKGEIEDSSDNRYFVDNNVCYCRTDNLRTNDICVSGDTFYSSLPFVVDYNGISYSIPLIYESSEEKYRLSVLYSPFINHILDRIISIENNVVFGEGNGITSHDINKIVKYCNVIYKDMNIEKRNSDIDDKVSTINTLSKEVLSIWCNYLHDRLSDLEFDINEGQEPALSRATLGEIEADAKSTLYNEDVFKHIYEVKQLLARITGQTSLNIKDRTIYILDTSVFMDMPKILECFDLAKDKVIVPRAMEQELDRLSHDSNREKKDNATKAKLQIRRKKDDYPQFLAIKENVDRSLLPTGFDPNLNDNDMLASAIELEQNDNIDKVVIVSNDYEFISNVMDCVNSQTISERIEGIDLDELLLRLGE